MNLFTLRVIEAIKKVPRGKVATYQQIAGLAGKEHASRAVSWILNSSTKKHALPWQRIVSKKGGVAFKPGTYHFRMQARLLKAEGVTVDPKTGAIDMKRFQLKTRKKRSRRPTPKMFG
ncbi:MAG TPA: MGMT family protein [Bdellovibrionales bacterium]|nr:MGMT family protein [Bdellovibrionales bacterium]